MRGMSFVIILVMKLNVYTDNAATTKINDDVLKVYIDTLKNNYANAQGAYKAGVESKCIINNARHKIAETLGSYDKEIIFTGSGSEADNLALIGIMEANKDKGRHFVTTAIEHHAILESAKYLKENGFMVTVVRPDENGIVSFESIKNAIREDTVLVSVMSVNNETGVYQPIEEIGKYCKERDIYFHTDAVQAYGKLSFKDKLKNIDLLSASAHKFNGPKGVGFLYVKNGVRINPFVHGGSQERGLRAGTENNAAIAAMGEAAKIAYEHLEENRNKVDFLYDLLKKKLTENIPDIKVNGIKNASGIGVLNICFKGVEGSTLLIHLDMEGICASSGAACVQSLDEPSHVLLAMGNSEEDVRSSIRLSLSSYNTEEEIEYLAKVLKEKVEYLRSMRI